MSKRMIDVAPLRDSLAARGVDMSGAVTGEGILAKFTETVAGQNSRIAALDKERATREKEGTVKLAETRRRAKAQKRPRQLRHWLSDARLYCLDSHLYDPAKLEDRIIEETNRLAKAEGASFEAAFDVLLNTRPELFREEPCLKETPRDALDAVLLDRAEMPEEFDEYAAAVHAERFVEAEDSIRLLDPKFSRLVEICDDDPSGFDEACRECGRLNNVFSLSDDELADEIATCYDGARRKAQKQQDDLYKLYLAETERRTNAT